MKQRLKEEIKEISEERKREREKKKEVWDKGIRRWQDLSLRLIYSRDQSEVPGFFRWFIRSVPQEIVQPTSIEELQEILQSAYQRKIPVTPGAGRSFALGGAIPTKAGISLDLSFMNRILKINPEEEWVLVEAGVRWSTLSDELKKYGFALRTYPSSWFSTVGGWVNTGGYGIGSLKYGSLKENVIGLKVVTPKGELWKVVPGMPQFDLFFGSEGQLGVIAEVRLLIRKKPATIFPLLFAFPSDSEALQSIQNLLSAGLRPFYLIFLDREKMKEMNSLMKQPLLPESPCVLTIAESEEEKEMILHFLGSDVPINTTGISLHSASAPSSRGGGELQAEYLAEYLWNERFFPLKAKKFGPGLLASDVVMPVQKVLPYIQRCRELAKGYGIGIAVEVHFSTPGSALVLPTFPTDSRKPFLYLLHSALAYQLASTGIHMGGKPYGIGLWYKRFLNGKWKREEEIQWKERKESKKKLDPLGLLNPGKSLGRGYIPPGVPFFARPVLALLSRLWVKRIQGKTRKKPTPPPPAENVRWTGYMQSNPLLHSISACSACGACYAKCPAYLVTRDERTTARGKLQLTSEILLKKNRKITAEEAQTMFLCMHCGFCTEVCQSELDLEASWNFLEAELEKRYGKPVKRIEEFVKKVEESGVMTATRP